LLLNGLVGIAEIFRWASARERQSAPAAAGDDMARYFFHTHHDVETLDAIGRELMSHESAWHHAVAEARAAAASEVKALGTLSLSHRIEVTDEQGTVVTTVLLADAVRVRV
jgi:hypothetical protein